jgi:hypothetical protein
MAYSICISTIFKSIPKMDIQECMEKHLGKVSRIDFLDLNKDNRRVFVHFSEWYSNKGKGCSDIVLHQLETNGFCHFYIPNKKNKKNPDFYAKLLINKNPLSNTDYKLQKLHTNIGELVATVREQDHKIDVLESKVLLLENSFISNSLSKLYSSYDMDMDMDMDDVMGHMNINELSC